jgi:glycosyltransferase involved in cell wall biosynthesis
MSAHGIDRRKMFCIANSLDSKRNLEIRKTLEESDVFVNHFGNSFPVVIFSGRMQKSKKIELLIEAVYKMKKSGKIVNVVLVGPVFSGYDIDEIIAKYGVQDQVWQYGECYDDTVLAELLYNSTVCVSPGFVGLLAIHSLSFGCPVITHNNFSHQAPEYECIKEGVTGDFFEEDNVIDLQEKMEEWCSKSSQERKEIRRCAFEEIDRKWNVDYQICMLKKVTTL